MAIIVRRFIELAGVCAAISAVIKLVYNMGYLNSSSLLNVCVISGLAIFTVFNVYAMYSCAMFLMSSWHYYLFNYIAFALFTVVNYVVFFFYRNSIHSWLFGITRCFYAGGVKSFFAMAIFHLALFVIMTVVPLFANSNKIYSEEENWITDVFE